MKRHFIATASSIALLFGAASMASAADMTTQKRDTQPGTAAGMPQNQSEMNNHPGMTPGSTGGMRSSGADSSAMLSYKDNKKDLSHVTVPGGLSTAKLIGADVKNASGDEIGEIADLAVGSDGTARQAIVEVGGFLGIGSKYVAVDIDKLQPEMKGSGFKTNLTKEELKTNAEYKKEKGHWVHSYQ